MQALVLVVNPFASRVTQAKLIAVQEELARVAEPRILLTERPGHATELVHGACRAGADAVVVFSGDGGFNEALNGLDRDIPIGFLPGGGTSVLSRALGLPPDPVKAAQQIADAMKAERTRRITVGRVNGRRFAFGAGIGLDAEAVRLVDRMGRTDEGKRPGDLAFALAILRRLAATRGHMEPCLEVKGFGRAAFAIIANGIAVHVREADPAADRARGAVRARPRSRRAGTRRSAARSCTPRPRSSPATCRITVECCTATTSTGSRSSATSRCRSTPTARTSATSRRW